MTDGNLVLEATDLVRTFRLPRRSLLRPRRQIRAVDGVSISLAHGEALGLVGESGSGKSTLARLLVGIQPYNAGRIVYSGRDAGDGAGILRRAQMVFQDAGSSLDPRMRIGAAVREPLRAMQVDGDHESRVDKALAAVQLPAGSRHKYPHQMSGGQMQRVAIARALVLEPDVLVADEPVSALDVSVQAKILNLLSDLRRDLGLSLVLVTHDLAVAYRVCDRIAVMYAGRIVEEGPTDRIFEHPEHPYTRMLLDSILTLGGELPSAEYQSDGRQHSESGGCSFAPRCPLAEDQCRVEDPSLRSATPDNGSAAPHRAACHFAFAPKV